MIMADFALHLQQRTSKSRIMTDYRHLSQDDILKLKAVVLYIVDKCGETDCFHIFKILYFADREHYAVYGRRIVNDTFHAMKNGPVPSALYNAIKDVTGKEPLPVYSKLKTISSALREADSMYDHYICAVEKPDMDELSASDIEMLDKSIAANLPRTFGELSGKSHDEAWMAAFRKKPNSKIDPLLMAKAGGASDDTLDFIKEMETINSLAY